MELDKNHYQCGHCKGIFEKGWSDEEAEAESKKIFGKPSSRWKCGKIVICDDCFNKMHPLNNPDLLAETILNL